MLDVQIITKENPSAELKQMETVLRREISKLKQDIQYKEDRSEVGLDFNIYIGYDYSALSHFFRYVDSTDSFFIFFGPAGEGPEDSINNLVRDCVDNMGCSPEVYKKVAGVWSYKEIISYIKQKSSTKKFSTAVETP